MSETLRPTEKPERLHYGTKSLKDRGWTDALIRRFLPDPDKLAPNPHYRSAAPWKLYLISRVEEVERSDAFKVAKSQSQPRKQAARAAVETKRGIMKRHLEGLTFEVPRMDHDELIRRACRHYNARQSERAERRDGDWDYEPATASSSAAFLERISVNYLRHGLTPYDDRLDEVAGKVGVKIAYGAIVAKVLDAIAETYPWLKEECSRQKAARLATKSQETTTDA